MRITPALGLTRTLRRFKSTRKPTPSIKSKQPTTEVKQATAETKHVAENGKEDEGGEREMVRYKPLVPLTRPRELILACTPMRSNVNLSSIARNSGCAGIEKMIVTGPDGKILSEVARNTSVKFSFHQSLAPQIAKLKKEGK
jgi:hypothetical protein